METSSSTEDLLGEESGVARPGGPPPLSKLYRYSALFFMCFLGFGSYFCFDNPGALPDVISKDMSLTTTQFTYLYSSYSWPNVVLCFIGGFLIDRVFGIRLGAALYAFIIFIGQIIFACGSLWNSFFLMIIGRIVFGIGGESLAVAQNYYAVLWFKGKELNMVFGLQLSFARVGSAVNFIVMSPLYNYVNQYIKGRECLGVTLLLASLTCLFSFLCALILAWLDKKANENKGPPEIDEEEKVVRLSDITDFSLPFWLVCVICVTYYIAIFPFIALGKVFFMRKFGLSSEMANYVNSFLYTISAVASPLMGLLVDKTGRNIMWLFISIIATIGAHSLLAFTFENPFYAMTALGLSYSMCASALWPMISLVIPDYQLGTAYGVAQALQNLGMALATLFAGMVVDAGGYFMLEIFFLGWLYLALLACCSMWIYDLKSKGILNMSVTQRDEYEKYQTMDTTVQTEGSSRRSVSDINPYNVTQPQSPAQIRNRYLSRIGELVPLHIGHSLKHHSVYRAMR